MKVMEVMNSVVHVISSGKSVEFASGQMNELGIGSLVVEDHGQLIGIVTSKDIRSSHPNRIVADAMTPNPVTIEKNQFVWDALLLMETNNIERLIVTDQGQMAGIVTREAVKSAINMFVDPLTGLYKSAYIQYIAENFLQRKRIFQFLFFDLNDFGSINKKFGHPAGDDILVSFAQRMQNVKRETDYLCRYGGDEFLLLTLRGKKETLSLIQDLSEPVVANGVTVSLSVGAVFGEEEPDFFALSFREILNRASLLSTKNKAGVL